MSSGGRSKEKDDELDKSTRGFNKFLRSNAFKNSSKNVSAVLKEIDSASYDQKKEMEINIKGMAGT